MNDTNLRVPRRPKPRTSYRRLLPLLKPYRRPFALGLACMVVFGATDGLVPLLIKHVLDDVFLRHESHLLWFLPIILIGFAIVRAVCDFGQQYLMSKVGFSIVRDLRNKIFAHLQRLSSDFFLSNSSAALVARVTNDVTLLRNLLTESLAAIVRDSIRVVALLAAALYLDPLLAACAFLLFPIGFFPVYRFGRKMRKLSRVGQESLGSLSAVLQEATQGHRVVKIFTAEEIEQRRFETENEHLHATFMRAERIRALTGPINEVLAALAISAVILYGGWSVIGGTRSQGEFLAFLTSVFLLYDPFKKLSKVHGSLQLGMAGADRIYEVLDTEPTIVDPPLTRALPARNDLVLEGITFRYPGADMEALRGVSLAVGEGERIALVGLSGSGKSTLLDLFARFIDPTAGRVLLGGVDLRELGLADIRGKMALVSQHTFLFNASVLENIVYGRPGASREEVESAARAAHAYEFIMRLPAGFDTKIGEGGMSLSGGERQRLALARAILKNAPILLLDEATAALDNRSEREVQAAIKTLEQGRTTITVAHRLSTIQDAQRICVMRGGEIVEIGTHAELLAENGEYAHLHKLQYQSGASDGSAAA